MLFFQLYLEVLPVLGGDTTGGLKTNMQFECLNTFPNWAVIVGHILPKAHSNRTPILTEIMLNLCKTDLQFSGECLSFPMWNCVRVTLLKNSFPFARAIIRQRSLLHSPIPKEFSQNSSVLQFSSETPHCSKDHLKVISLSSYQILLATRQSMIVYTFIISIIFFSIPGIS